jgi:hypothetical protein
MKKKIYFVLGCASILVFIYGFYRYRVASWFLFLLLGLYLIFNDKLKPLLYSPDAVSDKGSKPKKQPTKSFSNFDVVGVTFSNDDGTDRQKLLKKLYFHDKPFDGDLLVTLDRYLWKGDPAYYVKVNDYIIGNIEADMVYFFENNRERPCEMRVEVHCSKSHNVYGAELFGKFLDVE